MLSLVLLQYLVDKYQVASWLSFDARKMLSGDLVGLLLEETILIIPVALLKFFFRAKLLFS